MTHNNHINEYKFKKSSMSSSNTNYIVKGKEEMQKKDIQEKEENNRSTKMKIIS